jgi:hypothetical protein
LMRSQHNLMGKRGFSKMGSRAGKPFRQISVKADSTLGVQEERLPSADRRKPKFVVSIPKELTDATPKPLRLAQTPQPDMCVE